MKKKKESLKSRENEELRKQIFRLEKDINEKSAKSKNSENTSISDPFVSNLPSNQVNEDSD